MPQCQKRIMAPGMSMHFRQCHNFTVEGSVYCHTHVPKPPKPLDLGKQRLQTAMYIAGLRGRALRRKAKENHATTE